MTTDLNEWFLRKDISDNEKIQRIAYFKWKDAGCPFGKCKDFWSKAEKDYRALKEKLEKKHGS
mgnify:CR=1 FL=1